MTRLRAIMLGLAIMLPVLTLIPLGSLWLWQNGWLLHWVIGALAATALFYGLEASTIGRSPSKVRSPDADFTDPNLVPKERAALTAVQKLADDVDPAQIATRNDVLILARLTIEAVAREFHPSDHSPVWNFTVPEILLLAERVSARLRPVIIETIPLGEQLTVGQALRVYEWRSIVGTAEKLYDIWRVLRIFNPVAAATQEARERITKQIVASVRDDLTKRVLRLFVIETGAAAIELYSGRLKAGTVANSAHSPVAPPPHSDAPVHNADHVRPSRPAAIWREVRKISQMAGRLYGRKSRDRQS
jgi:uncharacterized protein